MGCSAWCKSYFPGGGLTYNSELNLNSQTQNFHFERLLVHPRDYNKEIPLESTPQLVEQIQNVLLGKPSKMMQAALWNGGFYLWHSGICPDFSTGLTEAEALLTSGKVAQKLEEITKAVAAVSPNCSQ